MSVVLMEEPEAGVRLLRINRPEARNALNQEVRDRMAELVTEAAADEAVRVLVLAGQPEAFAGGADIKAMAEASAVDMMSPARQRLWRALGDCPKPVIAAVRGYALGGGCELAMHCDMIMAGESARFGQPEIRLGIIPGAGGTQRLMRAVGKSKAMRLILTGEMIDARAAEAMGLVTEVLADDEVEPQAIALGAKIARRAPLAVELAKEVTLRGADAPLATALDYERRAFQLLFATEDQKEGMRAFIDKRTPEFKGR